MLRILRNFFLIASIALIGADRIDLLAGHGFFTFTPFLFFAPLAVPAALLPRAVGGNGHLTFALPVQRQSEFLAPLVLFLLFILASIPFGLDPERGAVLFIGLLLVAGFGYCVSVLILSEPNQEKLIVRSVTFSLIVYLIFCVGECISFSNGVYMAAGQGLTWSQSVFAPGWIGNLAPRLSGATIDPNRAGFLLTLYLVLLDRFTARSRYTLVLRYAIAFFVFLTFSRSAILCWLVYNLLSKDFWKRLASRKAAVGFAAVAFVISFAVATYHQEIENLVADWEFSEIVSTKMDMSAGSSGQDHIALIHRGLEVWQSSPQTLISGIGFGSAPKVLSDFFGDDKYGNFHCLYVSILAESGPVAFALLMFILCYPALARKGTVRCILAIMVFNVTYQSQMEPLLWVVLALLWSFEKREQSWGFASLAGSAASSSREVPGP